MNIPNALTVSRVVLIPVFVIIFYAQKSWSPLTSAAIFAVAGFTDWLDGYLARRWQQSTRLGAFLDPVADKIIVAVALVMLTEIHHSPWFTLPAIIIVGREIVISALREWMAAMGNRTSVAVSYIGKLKTTFQMLAIGGFLMIGQEFHGVLFYLSYALLYGAAILTLWSMVMYIKAAWPELMADENPK